MEKKSAISSGPSSIRDERMLLYPADFDVFSSLRTRTRTFK